MQGRPDRSVCDRVNATVFPKAFFGPIVALWAMPREAAATAAPHAFADSQVAMLAVR
jgi:hypothetical protein